jgi:pimeloyl-ACP methyl ester carboxylesterase
MDLLRVPILGRIILLFSSKIMIKSQLEAVYYDKSFVDDKLVNAVYSPFLRQGFIRATLKSYRNADFHFVQDNLNKIKLPTLLIWGDRDTIHPVQMAEEMKNEIKGSQLVVFGECGHLPHSEKSEQFNYHAGKFIAKIQARAYTQYGSKANP